MTELTPEERATVVSAWKAAAAGAPVLTDLASAVVLMHRAGWIFHGRALGWARQTADAQVRAFLPNGDLDLVLRRVMALEAIGKLITDQSDKVFEQLGKMAEPLADAAGSVWSAITVPFKFAANLAIAAAVVGTVVLVVVVTK